MLAVTAAARGLILDDTVDFSHGPLSTPRVSLACFPAPPAWRSMAGLAMLIASRESIT
jgi:hypothetical protein